MRDPIEDWAVLSSRAAGSTAVRAMRTERHAGPAAGAGVALVTVALVAIGAALVLRPNVAPAAENPVTARADDGMFRLALTTPRSTYTTVDDIEPVASLTYLGPDPMRMIYHAVHPMSFRIEEIDGPRAMDGGTDMPCNFTMLTKDRPVDQPFAKSGSPTDDPAKGFDRAWYENPVLRLPAGRWRIIVDLVISVDGCGGPRHDMTISNDITVSEFAARPDPIAARVDDGMFRLELTTPRGIYGPNDSIEPVATVTYIGPGPDQTMYQGTSPILFYLDEIGGTRKMSGALGPMCATSPIRKDTPLVYPFFKSGAIDESFDRSWWDDPVLRLPPGTWRIRVQLIISTTNGTDTCGAIPHDLTVDNVIEVVGPKPSASETAASLPPSVPPVATPLPTIGPSFPPPSDGPISDVADDGVFRLELMTPSGIYGRNEAIKPVARLTYVGSGRSVTFGHGDPPIYFMIEQLDGDRQMSGGADDVCEFTTMKRGEATVVPFQKAGQIGLGFDLDWFQDPVLTLPPGTYRISVHLEAIIPECGPDADLHEVAASNLITVVAVH